MNLNDYAEQSHKDNIQWWRYMDGSRKGLMDDKLPTRSMEEVELADLLIRVFDYAGAYELDLEGAYQEKRIYNSQREDHKHTARQAEGGKKW